MFSSIEAFLPIAIYFYVSVVFVLLGQHKGCKNGAEEMKCHNESIIKHSIYL